MRNLKQWLSLVNTFFASHAKFQHQPQSHSRMPDGSQVSEVCLASALDPDAKLQGVVSPHRRFRRPASLNGRYALAFFSRSHLSQLN
jgi:hypothetical protein